jgi:phosphoglycolate phosphatase-like HAD superfamily hydrolase
VTPVLVVFDVDGTLLRSAGEHHGIMVEVLARSGLDALAKPWASYRHYTDSGVIDEIVEDTHGRSVTAEELAGFDAEYLAGLEEFLRHTEIVEIPGARALLADLAALPEVHVAFATGSLRSMALRKLGILGVDTATAVLATGEHRTREEIVTAAVTAVRERVDGPLRLVVLGDGPWDERTAVSLGIPFVAVQSGQHVFGDVPVRVVTDLTEITAAELVGLAAPEGALDPAGPSL